MKITAKRILAAVMTLVMVFTITTLPTDGLKAASQDNSTVAGQQLDGDNQGTTGEEEATEPAEPIKAEKELNLASGKSSGDVSYEAEVKDQVKVEAVAKEGTFEGDVELNAEMLDKTEKKEAEKLMEEQEIQFDGFLPINLSFMNGNKEQEPDGTVDFSMEIDRSLISEDADMESLQLVHFVEDEQTGEVKEIVEIEDADINVKDGVVVADFDVDSLSTFTLKWKNSSNKSIALTVIDNNGNEIGQSTTKEISGTTDFVKNAPEIDGYVFQRAVVAKSNTAAIATDIQNYMYINYQNSNWVVGNSQKSGSISSGKTIGTDEHVYLIYRSEKIGNHYAPHDVHHIDILDNMSATVIIDGEAYDVEFNLTPEDAENIKVSAKFSDGTPVPFNWETTTVTDDKDLGVDRSQVRLDSDATVYDYYYDESKYADNYWGAANGFPVGTKDDQVYYTVELDKTVTVYIKDKKIVEKGTRSAVEYNVPIQLSLTLGYWDETNTCPELTSKNHGRIHWAEGQGKGFSGLDIQMENGIGGLSGTITVQKDIEGTTLTSDKTFTFDIYNSSKELYKTINITLSAGQTSAQVLLPLVPFDTYTVREKADSAEIPGYAVSTQTEYFANGGSKTEKIVLSEDTPKGTALVTNNYTQNTTTAQIEGLKVLKGRALKADEFTFKLKDSKGNTLGTKTNAADGTFKFDAISYDKAGTYEYTVNEVKPAADKRDAKVTYDETEYTVTVSVKQNEETKKLEATVTYKNGDKTADVAAFENTYTPDPATAQIKGHKILKGRILKAGEFSFELKDGEGETVDTAANNANGEISFKTLSFDKAGEYTYTVNEVVPEDADREEGVTYDNNEFTVTVTVSGDSATGNLSAAVAYKDGDDTVDIAAFENAFIPDPAKAEIKGEKELNGRALKDGEFSFKLKDSEGKEVETVTNDELGKFSFGEISYDKAGTYNYTVKEVIPADADKLPGVTYDTNTYNVKVVVTKDDTTGNLSAATEYAKGENKVQVMKFTNTYKPESVEKQIEGLKNMEGRPLKADEFSFVLKNDKDETVDTVKNAVDGTFKFKKIEYKSVGTYEYTVSEVKPAADKRDAKVTYDETEYAVTVTVTDNTAEGKLVARLTYKNGDNTVDLAAFENTYTPDPTKAKIVGEKELKGRTLEANEFEFELKDSEGKVIDKTKNAADMSFGFKEIEYTKAMMGGSAEKTFTYTVNEVIPQDADKIPGVTYDEKTYTVKVKVTKDAETGNLTAADPVYETGGNAVEVMKFKNDYKPAPTQIEVKGTKELTGKKLEAGMFEFQLTNEKGEAIEGVPAVKNDKDGNFKFAPIKITKAGEYTYKVNEVIPDKKISGVTYTTEIKTVTATVVDNTEKGQLEVTTKESALKVDFTNVFKTSAVIEGTKVLTGKILKEEDFGFELKNEKGDVLQTVKNDKDGNFKFNAIEYSEAGEYKYTVNEVIPKDADKVAGITYDETVLNVTVSVKMDEDLGELKAEVKYPENGLVFTNEFETSAVIEGSKTLTGMDLEKDQFTFQLLEGKNVVGETTNDANGKIAFDPISYKKEGTHKYTIVEVIPENTGKVKYDESKFDVTVEVAMDKEAEQLKAEVKYPEGGVVFKNIGLTDLMIVKTLDEIEVREGFEAEPQTFVFDVKIYDPEDKEKLIFSNVYGLNFHGDFTDHQKDYILIKNLPIGAKAVVTELNSGVSYTDVSTDAHTKTLKVKENTIDFENQYNHYNNREHGVQNSFFKNDGWNGRQADNTDNH